MVKALNGKGNFLFGLTVDEIDYLKSGKAIMFTLNSVGARGSVTLIVGRTDEEIRKLIENKVKMQQNKSVIVRDLLGG